MVWLSLTLLSLSQTLVPLAFHCLWEDFEGRAHGDQNRVGADCEKYSLPERCRLLYLIQCTTAGCCMSATAGNPGRYHRSSDAPAKSPQPYLPPSLPRYNYTSLQFLGYAAHLACYDPIWPVGHDGHESLPSLASNWANAHNMWHRPRLLPTLKYFNKLFLKSFFAHSKELNVDRKCCKK